MAHCDALSRIHSETSPTTAPPGGTGGVVDIICSSVVAAARRTTASDVFPIENQDKTPVNETTHTTSSGGRRELIDRLPAAGTTTLSDRTPVATIVHNEAKRIIIDFVFDTPVSAFGIPVATTAFSTLYTNHQEVILEIQTDPDFGPIYNYLANGELPADDKTARRLILESEWYDLIDGALYYKFIPRSKNLQRCFAEIKVLCIPQTLRAKIAFATHDQLFHPGLTRCYGTARREFYFKNMHEYFKNHILSCDSCKKSKPINHPNRTLIQNLPSAEPLQRWNLDLMDRLIFLWLLISAAYGQRLYLLNRFQPRIQFKLCLIM